ncbi:hypothetical protein ACJX0J_018518, partial [Zea mays]
TWTCHKKINHLSLLMMMNCLLGFIRIKYGSLPANVQCLRTCLHTFVWIILSFGLLRVKDQSTFAGS